MRKILNWILNIKAKYFESETFALDEKVKDKRDYIMGTIEELPPVFIINDNKFQNQGTQYKTRNYCVAMSTTNAINEGRFLSGIQTNYSGETLGDIMVEEKKLDPKRGAYVIDGIKTAKRIGWFSSYYQTDTLQQIKTALYRGSVIVTGSTKIDWSKARNGKVNKISKGSGHAFTVTGYDDRKRIKRPTRDNTKKGLARDYFIGAVVCENSYGGHYQDEGGFWIPYELIEQGILFNTKKAIIC